MVTFGQQKECSNQKIEENKSGLEFNFQLKSKGASLIFFISHRALICMIYNNISQSIREELKGGTPAQLDAASRVDKE